MARFLGLPFCLGLLNIANSLTNNNPNISFCFSHEYPSDCQFQTLITAKFEFGQIDQNVLNMTGRNEPFLHLKCEASYPIRWLCLQPLGSVSHIPPKGNGTMDPTNFKYVHQIYVELKSSYSQIFRCLSFSNANAFSELFLNEWSSQRDEPAVSFDPANFNSFIVEEFTEKLSVGRKKNIVPCVAKKFGPKRSVKLVKYSNTAEDGISFPSRDCIECICKASSDCVEGQFPCESPNVCGTLPSLIWKRNEANATENAGHNISDDLQCISNSTCAVDKLLTHFWGLFKQNKETDCDGDGVVTCYDYALARPSNSTECALPVTPQRDKLTACLINVSENFTLVADLNEDYDPRIGFRIQEEPNGNHTYECYGGKEENVVYNPLRKKYSGQQAYARLSLQRKNGGEVLIKCDFDVSSLPFILGECNSILECELKFNSVLPRVQIYDWHVSGRDDVQFHIFKNTDEVVPKFPNGFIICSGIFRIRQEPNFRGFVYDDDHLFTGLDNQLYLVSKGIPPKAVMRFEAIEGTNLKAENIHFFTCDISTFLVFPQVYFQVKYKGKVNNTKQISIGQNHGGSRAYELVGDESKLMKSWRLELLKEAVMIAVTCNSRWIKSEGLVSTEIRLNISSQTPKNDAKSINTFSVVVGLCALFFVLGLILLTFSLWRKLRKSRALIRNLTLGEIDDFLKGDSAQALEYDDIGCINLEGIAFPMDQIIQGSRLITGGKLLGKGAYGMVSQGLLDGEDVAIKMTKPNADVEYFKSFLKEIKLMSYIGENENIKFHGAAIDRIKERICYAVLELICPLSNLNLFVMKYSDKTMEIRYLTQENLVQLPQKLNASTLVCFSKQISSGMEFLSQKKVVHGDLATRNVLVFPNNVVKITDFGLSRKLYNYGQYIKSKQAPLPWRWMAIESLKHLKFSTSSDVWSFGVTLWEIFSFGQVPFSGLTWSPTFIDLLESGERLAKPVHAPDTIYECMLKCWDNDAEKRPSFLDCKTLLFNLEPVAQQNDQIYGTLQA